MFRSKSKSIIAAAKQGDLKKVEKLLAQDASLLDSKDAYGTSALHWAANNGHTEVVRLLIEEGADIEARNQRGATALFCATSIGHLEATDLLLEKTADIDTQDNHGWTALIWAAATNQAEIVHFLITKGADIEVKNKDGNTALNLAAANGHTKTVKVLLDKGADIDTKNLAGKTPVRSALNQGHRAVIQLLEARASQTSEKWVLLGPDKVAHVSTHAEIGTRLTEIFNFSSREKTQLSQNLQTRAEAISPPVSFDALEDTALRKAFDAFTKLEGKADEDFVFRHRKLRQNQFPPHGG